MSLGYGSLVPDSAALGSAGNLDLVVRPRNAYGPMLACENMGVPENPAREEKEDLLTGIDRFADVYGVDLLDIDGASMPMG